MPIDSTQVEALKTKALDETYQQLQKDISTFSIKTISQNELDQALDKLTSLNQTQEALYDAAKVLPEKNAFRKKISLYHQFFPHTYNVLRGDLHYHLGLYLIENYIKNKPVDTLSMLKKAQHCLNESVRLYEMKVPNKTGFLSPLWFEYLEEKLLNIKATLQDLYR